MKKSIVLLISLLFITAISALILKNLDDTEVYVEEQNSKINKAQAIVLVKNLQTEISRAFSNNQDQISSVINDQFSEYYPLKIDNIDIAFKLKPYDKIDLNSLNSSDESLRKQTINQLNDLSVYNIDNLRYLLKGNKIESYKQLDNILNNFIKETYDSQVLEVKDYLGFFNNKDNELYELLIKLNLFKDFVNAYYILNKQGEVKYFELSFK